MEGFDILFAAQASGGKIMNTEDYGIEIASVFTDSRKAAEDGLFVAIVGENFDGNDFAAEVLDGGKAVAALCSREIDTDKPYILVDDTVVALGKIAAKYKEVCDVRWTVGITGSVGKTTTKDMTEIVLSEGYNTIKTKGNHNNNIGLPLTLLDCDFSTKAAVIEMGMNHFGEISYLTNLAKPNIAVITKIGVSHIENLGSRENIMKAKLEILDSMEPDAPLVLNGDDDLLCEYRDETRPVYFFGINNKNCDVRAENIDSDSFGQTFDIVYKGEKYPAELFVDGIHNVYDALAAFTVGVLTGIEPLFCASCLFQYSPSDLRQFKEKIGNITLVEDCYNASPDSMYASLRALSESDAGLKIACLGDMLELGDFSDTMHRDVGEFCGEVGIDYLFCYGEKSELMCEAARENGVKNAFHLSDKQEIADRIFDVVRDGDAVLFKGSRGMKMEEIIDMLKKKLGA